MLMTERFCPVLTGIAKTHLMSSEQVRTQRERWCHTPAQGFLSLFPKRIHDISHKLSTGGDAKRTRSAVNYFRRGLVNYISLKLSEESTDINLRQRRHGGDRLLRYTIGWKSADGRSRRKEQMEGAPNVE